MAPKPRAFIGFAEALSAPEVAWSLAEAGFEVFAIARQGRRSPLRHSRYASVLEITPPEVDAAAAVAEFHGLDAGSEYGTDLTQVPVLPLDDAAVWLCSQATLPKGWVLAGPGCEATSLALDKRYQVEAARAAGLKVPETWVAGASDDLSRCHANFPLILKPADAVSLRNGCLYKGRNWICADRDELERAVEAWRGNGTLLVQPFLRGTGEGIFGLATAQGVQAWSAHRRLRMMNPHGSGSSACVSQPVPEGLKGPVESLVNNSGWRGLFMVELLRDNSGQRWFVEFNGRAWGSMALSRRQGLEYPAWAVRLALDPDWRLPGTGHTGNEVVCRNLGRELMHLAFILRGRKSAAVRTWPSFWRSAADILRIRRRDCFYNFRRDDLRVFLSDCCCTMREQVFKSQAPRHKP